MPTPPPERDDGVPGRHHLHLLTSAYPRWAGDTTTPFVQHFARRMVEELDGVTVVAPHFVGAAVHEQEVPRLDVRRFRYFVPAGQQDIAYGGNAVNRMRPTPLYALKLLMFVGASLLALVRGRARLVNAHWLIPQGVIAVAAARLTGARVVVTVHGGDVFSLNGALLRRVKAWALRRADAVVVNSSATRQACEFLHPGRRYEVIPMGVDTDRFRPGPRSDELVQRHGLGDLTVLFVGRLTEDKGVDDLLRALALLTGRGVGFKALVVGSGDQEAALRSQAESLGLRGVVEFIGWVPSEELVAYYDTADVFVGPSIVGRSGWTEALGLVFVEALATGLPVIATNTGGIADVVTDGVTGFLVDERSPAQIAEKLELLARDRERLLSMAQRGRAAVEERFSWRTVGDRYAEVLRTAAR
jgi:glycosyltransferase involved in cell wall biosynthesis